MPGRPGPGGGGERVVPRRGARASWPASSPTCSPAGTPRTRRSPARIAGAALTVAGAAVLLHAFARFALDGLGTPAPVAPTEHLVVTGLYRRVRNPMYLAVTATILGQWLLLGRPVLLAYALVFLAITYAFVRGYEEPTLTPATATSTSATARRCPAGGRGASRRPDRPAAHVEVPSRTNPCAS